MSTALLHLTNDQLKVVLDPRRGADILSLVHTETGTDVLFQSPWHEHAMAVRAGEPARFHDPAAAWLEQYAGGWQVLCPNAGPARDVHGAPVGFHGEAAVATWEVTTHHLDRADLRVDLFAVPLTIEREITLDGDTLQVRDLVTNRSPCELAIDYVSHPAFGGKLLTDGARIEMAGGRFIADPVSTTTIFTPGSEHAWPHARDASGQPLDLRRVPPQGTRREVFGWLENLDTSKVTIHSPSTGLEVSVGWCAGRLPYAWLWQELEATPFFPWFQQARALAIEPSSTPTSGPQRASTLTLSPRSSVDLPVTVRVRRSQTSSEFNPEEINS